MTPTPTTAPETHEIAQPHLLTDRGRLVLGLVRFGAGYGGLLSGSEERDGRVRRHDRRARLCVLPAGTVAQPRAAHQPWRYPKGAHNQSRRTRGLTHSLPNNVRPRYVRITTPDMPT